MHLPTPVSVLSVTWPVTLTGWLTPVVHWTPSPSQRPSPFSPLTSIQTGYTFSHLKQGNLDPTFFFLCPPYQHLLPPVPRYPFSPESPIRLSLPLHQKALVKVTMMFKPVVSFQLSSCLIYQQRPTPLKFKYVSSCSSRRPHPLLVAFLFPLLIPSCLSFLNVGYTQAVPRLLIWTYSLVILSILKSHLYMC